MYSTIVKQTTICQKMGTSLVVQNLQPYTIITTIRRAANSDMPILFELVFKTFTNFVKQYSFLSLKTLDVTDVTLGLK